MLTHNISAIQSCTTAFSAKKSSSTIDIFTFVMYSHLFYYVEL